MKMWIFTFHREDFLPKHFSCAQVTPRRKNSEEGHRVLDGIKQQHSRTFCREHLQPNLTQIGLGAGLVQTAQEMAMVKGP